jgi:alkylation response protein AidB-like acyl-CoA dehydrogenase
MVQEKLAFMAAMTFAMESCAYQTAAQIDAGDDDYMLETAMLKVFSTDALWRIVNDTIQIFGGKAYFNDEPYERLMRDARINLIGEGANDVLRAFIALTGIRDVGLELKGVLDALASPLANLARLSGFASRRVGSLFISPEVQVRSGELAPDAERLGKLIGAFYAGVEKTLREHQEGILDKQLVLGRLADAATELYVSSCVLNRLDGLLRPDLSVAHAAKSHAAHGHGAHDHGSHDHAAHDHAGNGHDSHDHDAHDHAAHGHAAHAHGPSAETERDLALGRFYLLAAERRIRRGLADLTDNDDRAVVAAGKAALARYASS